MGELEATAAEGMAAAVGCDVEAALGMAAAVRVSGWWVARGGEVGVQVCACAYSSGGGGGPVNGDGCGAPPRLRLHTPAGHSRRRAASQQHLIVVVVVAEAFARAVCPVSAACSERGRGVGRASCRRAGGGSGGGGCSRVGGGVAWRERAVSVRRAVM